MLWCHSSGTTFSFQTWVTILCSVRSASLPKNKNSIIIIITDLYSAFSSEDTEALDADIKKFDELKTLQYFCQTLSISYFIDQRKLLFWRKLAMHNNNSLLSLSWLVQNRFYASGSMYGITTISASIGQTKLRKYTQTWQYLQTVPVNLVQTADLIWPNGSRNCSDTIQAANGIKPVLHEPQKR